LQESDPLRKVAKKKGQKGEPPISTVVPPNVIREETTNQLGGNLNKKVST